jgi:hypothetical protein
MLFQVSQSPEKASMDRMVEIVPEAKSLDLHQFDPFEM